MGTASANNDRKPPKLKEREMPTKPTGGALPCPHCTKVPAAQKQPTIPVSYRLDHTCGGGDVHFKASTPDDVYRHWNNWCRRQKPNG